MSPPPLDLRTFILLGGAMGLLLALVLFLMRRSYPPSIGGLREWTAAPLVCFFSAALFGLRGTIPEAPSVIAANLLLYSGYVLYYQGSQHFFGVRPTVRPWVLLGAALAVALFWFTQITPLYNVRIAAFNAVMVLVCWAHCRLYLQQPRLTFSGRLMLGVLVLQTLSILVRLLSVALGTPSGSLLDPTLLQSVYVAIFCLTILALAIGAILMVTDALREELEHLVAHDTLTGALSRNAFMAANDQELQRCKRHGRTMSILMIDLDHFKTINDTHGHLTGDQVLKDFVLRTGSLLRTLDRLGRYGGEEFLVLLPETDLQAAAIVAERIRAEVSTPRGTLPAYTISIGIASHENGHASGTVDTLIARADQAMYRAKTSGRNRTEWESRA